MKRCPEAKSNLGFKTNEEIQQFIRKQLLLLTIDYVWYILIKQNPLVC